MITAIDCFDILNALSLVNENQRHTKFSRVRMGRHRILPEQVPLRSDGLRQNDTMVQWTADHVRAITIGANRIAPMIGPDDFKRISWELDIWDAWPIQTQDGPPAALPQTLWMALSAPHFADPDERHGHARLHLFERTEEGWAHLGPVMPDGFSPGSREWSGSAVLDADGTTLTLYFTATGQRGEKDPTFTQRLFLARAKLKQGNGRFSLTDWHGLREIVQRDPAFYMATDGVDGGPGTIKAFRDPAYFRDPLSGTHYLFFAGSLAGSKSAFNGVVGAAVATAERPDDWTILPPLVSADGLNNELERPHVVWHKGLYYLFWSAQRHVFDPAGPVGPTGLYGMVSNSLDGGWKPLNGTGLVFANPPQAPAQAYSWLVLPDLSVSSFVDDWGPAADGRARRFGASFAPELHLKLDGTIAELVK